MLSAIIFSATVLVYSNSSAQSLSPGEKKQVDQMIEELHQKLHGGSATNNSRAVSTLQTILKSSKATYQYYMDCIKEAQFDSVGKRESEWRQWRERNEDRSKVRNTWQPCNIKRSSSCLPLQFHLRTVRGRE